MEYKDCILCTDNTGYNDPAAISYLHWDIWCVVHKPACHPIDNRNYSHYISVKLNAHRWIKINDPVLSIVERLGCWCRKSTIPSNCCGCFCSKAYRHQITQGLANTRNNLIWQIMDLPSYGKIIFYSYTLPIGQVFVVKNNSMCGPIY